MDDLNLGDYVYKVYETSHNDGCFRIVQYICTAIIETQMGNEYFVKSNDDADKSSRLIYAGDDVFCDRFNGEYYKSLEEAKVEMDKKISESIKKKG